MKVSIVVPVFNEGTTLEQVVRKVLALPLDLQLILVDDGSRDDSPSVIASLTSEHPEIEAVRHPANRGKGAAIRSGLGRATGEVTIIQDADLELNPTDIQDVLRPFQDPSVQAVFGNRFHSKNRLRWSASHVANRFLSWFASTIYGVHVPDAETCYKAIRTPLFRDLQLRSERFEIEIEITCKLLRRRVRIHDVPISYLPRRKNQGKKIGARDGLVAVFQVLYWRAARF